ncbi:hypothetical protein CH339_06905 [Rhodobium orientis]|uniref:Uncharacterized protein n=1 Tax=Rhodobium orientis TaxID=34017 RepID=A0A327JTW1_9HYPH|nr:hypothetical protein [Rhodobium orientis]RAI28342.1 hypothetical protein CH339_06905 [Rhodobium orientis]
MIKTALVLVILAGLYILVVLVARRHACTELPGGARIGFASVLDFSDGEEWPPAMRLQDGSGRVLYVGNGDVRFHRVPSNPGKVVLTFGENGEQRLAMEGEELMTALYPERWAAVKKERPERTSIMLTDLFTIHHQLIYNGTFGKKWCRTPWFPQ